MRPRDGGSVPAPLHTRHGWNSCRRFARGRACVSINYTPVDCLQLFMRILRQGAHVDACRFSASGKPCVSLGGAPSAVPFKKHAAPPASPAVPRDTRKSVREAPRKSVGSEAKPKPVEAEQGKEPAKKKVYTSCPFKQQNPGCFSLTF